MAITQTFLTADLGRNDVVMKVDSGTGFPLIGRIANPGYLVRIDTEYLLAIAQVVDGTIRIAQRGYDGTSAQPHDINALVMVSSLPSDFAPVQPGADTELPPSTPIQITVGEDVEFTADDVLSWGNRNRIIVITQEDNSAITLGAPSKAQDGLMVIVTIIATSVAVTITAENLLAFAGTLNDVAETDDGGVGGGLVLMAQNGVWNVLSKADWSLSEL